MVDLLLSPRKDLAQFVEFHKYTQSMMDITSSGCLSWIGSPAELNNKTSIENGDLLQFFELQKRSYSSFLSESELIIINR